ncbi:MAG: nucleotidyltransferase family protein [Saprospiraceae bacterium]|nr:nucleotidyltransferase family protein [Saprospiraceae bacterium]
MKAMLFAAGLGTRLHPLTLSRPKALVEVGGKTLLEHALRHLQRNGCESVIINVHYLASQIIEWLDKNSFEMEIAISDETDLLLDTGGGLQKAAWFLKDAPFLVYNTDILTNMNLAEFYRRHCAGDALATLAVRRRPSSRYLLFDENGLLCGWQHAKSGETRLSRAVPNPQALAFSGIHAVNPAIFNFMPANKQVFSMIDVYLHAAETQSIQAYPHDADIWFDIGTPAALEQVRLLNYE